MLVAADTALQSGADVCLLCDDEVAVLEVFQRMYRTALFNKTLPEDESALLRVSSCHHREALYFPFLRVK